MKDQNPVNVLDPARNVSESERKQMTNRYLLDGKHGCSQLSANSPYMTISSKLYKPLWRQPMQRSFNELNYTRRRPWSSTAGSLKRKHLFPNDSSNQRSDREPL